MFSYGLVLGITLDPGKKALLLFPVSISCFFLGDLTLHQGPQQASVLLHFRVSLRGKFRYRGKQLTAFRML